MIEMVREYAGVDFDKITTDEEARAIAKERGIEDAILVGDEAEIKKIADEIGISQAQVSRLEKGALERIRKQM